MAKIHKLKSYLRHENIDEEDCIIFLALYYKGDTEDLSTSQYADLLEASEDILINNIDYDWQYI